jgi:hypothetical protein
MFGAYRVVCANGMVVGETLAQYRKEHHQRIVVGELEDTITAGMKQFSDQAELWRQWADEVMEQEHKEALLQGLKLTKKDRETIENELEMETQANIWDEGTSKWLVFNILTQWITHQVQSRMKQVRLESKLARQMYGGQG